MLYEALGAKPPIFAHVPLILGPDKTRLSKRHGATSVMAYRDEGIVPEAFRNFLSLLGWTPQDSSKEVMGDAELISLFSLDGIAHSNAVFDRAKLDWFNTEYIRAYPAEELLPLAEEEWAKAELIPYSTDQKHLLATLKDFAGSFRSYFSDTYENDPAAVEKFLKDAATRELILELATRYESLPDWTEQSTEQALRELATEKCIKAGALINGSRVAITGQGVAPSLFAVMVNLGRERTIARMKKVTSL
jgi:glutamyl-tRNA synthetase